MKNYYDILRVRNFADCAEIKKSFRKLAVTYHPDKNKGRKDYEEKFKEIANAYEILTDPDKKRDFDFRLSQQETTFRPTETPKQENNSRPNQRTKNETKKEETREFKVPIFWIIIIVCFILYLINNSVSENKTTTGNVKADKELNKEENSKKPKTGEIDFKK